MSIRRTITLTAATVAFAAPAAQAMPMHDPSEFGGRLMPVHSAPPRVHSLDDGLDVGSAGLGAAGGAALLTLVGLGAGGLSRRRHAQPAR